MANKEELTLKEAIIKIRGWVKYLLSKWLVIGIVGIVCAGLGILYAFLSKPTYSATVSFVLSSNSQADAGILGLASQFGIDLSAGTTDAFSGENIITLMNSQSIIKRILFKKIPENNEILVNMIARELKLDDSWAKNERTKNSFPFPDALSKLSPIQDSLVREMYEPVTKNLLQVSRPDKDAGFYEVIAKSTNELTALYLSKYVVDETTRFYIETKTSVSKKNLDMMQKEADSLRILLSGAISSTASSYDKTYNLNPALQVERSSAQEGQLRITAIGTAYGEVLKNLEIAKITLEKETPLYQIIDEPNLPLKANKPSKLLWLIIGGIIGGFFCCFYLLIRKIWKEYMN